MSAQTIRRSAARQGRPTSGRPGSTPANAFGPYRDTVDLVQDGETVYAKLDAGFDRTVYTRIRIDGINVPELCTQAGKDARDFARSSHRATQSRSVPMAGTSTAGASTIRAA